MPPLILLSVSMRYSPSLKITLAISLPGIRMEQEEYLTVDHRSGMGKVKLGSLHTKYLCRWRFSSLEGRSS